MKRVVFLIALLWMIVSTGSIAQVRVVDFKQLEPFLHQYDDTTYVINFWATWCAPCVEELPYFEKARVEFASKKLKIYLISLDFPRQLESRLLPFIKQYNIGSEVMLLDDPDANAWIDKVSPDWSGAIPGTLVYRNNKKQFFEKKLSYKELHDIIHQYLYEK
jgi:thiol-disulfide isomerase/thioredoxin